MILLDLNCLVERNKVGDIMSYNFHWKGIGTFLFVGFCVSMLVWEGHSFVKQQEADDARHNRYVYSYDRSNCRVYTVLVDFDFHPGFRRSVTLTMENGDKFLYACGERYIDICNHLKVGTRACYDDLDITEEVVMGWNEKLK